MNPAIRASALAPGLRVSPALTGLWQIADLERQGPLDLDAAADAMTAYVDVGLTSFDMADHYGSAEDIAGRYAQRHPSRRIQCLTKWVPPPGRLTREDVRAAVQRSLGRLRVERLDLLQFHAWRWADPSWLDALFWLQELKHEGLLAHLGVTNFDTAHLRVALASGIEIITNQVCYSLLDQRPRARLADLCRAHGVTLLAYGTLAGGFLSQRWLGRAEPGADELSTWSQMKYMRFIQAAGGWRRLQDLLRVLHEVSLERGAPMASVASRYVLDSPAVAAVIIGARLGVSQHLQDTLDMLQLELDDASRSRLADAASQCVAIPGDCGDEYRRPPYLTASGDLRHHVIAFPSPYVAEAQGQERLAVSSGTRWEDLAGFCRAVRHGNRIWISGTTATHRDRLIGGTDAVAQTHFVIDKIEGALQSLGGGLGDVVRTRIYVSDTRHWEPVARAHGERFREIRPANTLVQAKLIGDDYLVEIEADAVLGA